MVVYAIESAWVLGPVVWDLLRSPGVLPVVPALVHQDQPVRAGVGPLRLADLCERCVPRRRSSGGLLVLSAGLVGYAVLRLRSDLTNRSATRIARWSARLGQVGRRLSAGSRVHHWIRTRSSGASGGGAGRRGWLGSSGACSSPRSLAGTGLGLATISDDYPNGQRFLAMVAGLQATFGLLLVSLIAPTVLAEERMRGSLDVLMTTPLPTHRIVLAKWWGAYRVVPALALLPMIGAIVIAVRAPESVHGLRQPPSAPLTAIDRIAFAIFPVAFLLVQGAAVTSVGLALATWMRRLGRAVAVSVASYAFVAFAWIIILELRYPHTVPDLARPVRAG